jgi:hypothetical protein
MNVPVIPYVRLSTDSFPPGTRLRLNRIYRSARKGDKNPNSLFIQSQSNRGSIMTLTVSIGPVIALIAGILILLMPRLLNFIVAIYLILIGLLGLFGGPHGLHV